MTFEDPTTLARCVRSDCQAYRAGASPFCAAHLREQEMSAPGIVEPDLEARLALVRTEDDEHPGQKKIWHDDGTSEWVPDDQPPARIKPSMSSARVYVGPDPDTVVEFERALAEPEPGPARSSFPAPSAAGPAAGCWVAYQPDWSALAVFADELEALRHAVANSMSVGWATWGQPLGAGRPEPREDR